MNQSAESFKLSLQVESLVKLWEEFCHLHQNLLDHTQEEYKALLENDLDLMNELVDKKVQLIETIKTRDAERVSLLRQLDSSIEDINNLFDFLERNQLAPQAIAIGRYNSLLLDIVDQTQEQNKKNQFYLNRALRSLQDLRESFSGEKSLSIYGKNGSLSQQTNK